MSVVTVTKGSSSSTSTQPNHGLRSGNRFSLTGARLPTNHEEARDLRAYHRAVTAKIPIPPEAPDVLISQEQAMPTKITYYASRLDPPSPDELTAGPLVL